MAVAIQEHREEAGFTRSGLARLAGIHVRTLRRIEQGIHAPSAPTILAIAKALNVPPGSLLAHDTDGTPAVAPCGESSDTEARRPTLASVEGETGSKQEGA